jgi:2-polyprenyl-3-methyl-5-hydroxy-6-metoxy-1,4-benzoquinol methylase
MSNKVDPYIFWRNPEESDQPEEVINMCRPEFYLDLVHVTELVVSTLANYIDKSDTILEIGSGTGRNLAGLIDAGYHHVSGIEINQSAIDLGREKWATLADIPMQCSPIEDAINDIPEYDVIFTQGVLMHLPPQSEWVFGVIARKAKRIIMTIENEFWTSDRAWPRNYGDIFKPLGWRELLLYSCGAYPPLPYVTMLRVFEREI